VKVIVSRIFSAHFHRAAYDERVTKRKEILHVFLHHTKSWCV